MERPEKHERAERTRHAGSGIARSEAQVMAGILGIHAGWLQHRRAQAIVTRGRLPSPIVTDKPRFPCRYGYANDETDHFPTPCLPSGLRNPQPGCGADTNFG